MRSKSLWFLLVFWICACYYELVDIFWSVKRFLRKEEKWAESHRTKEKETLLTIRSCIQEMWIAGRFSKTIRLPASFWEIIQIFHCLQMFSLKILRMYPVNTGHFSVWNMRLIQSKRYIFVMPREYWKRKSM